MDSMWILYNKRLQTETTVVTSITVGRSVKADIVSRSTVISRQHAYFKIIDGNLYVQDNKSVNGTYINNERIKDNIYHQLSDRDDVILGIDDDTSKNEKCEFIIKKVPRTIRPFIAKESVSIESCQPASSNGVGSYVKQKNPSNIEIPICVIDDDSTSSEKSLEALEVENIIQKSIDKIKHQPASSNVFQSYLTQKNPSNIEISMGVIDDDATTAEKSLEAVRVENIIISESVDKISDEEEECNYSESIFCKVKKELAEWHEMESPSSPVYFDSAPIYVDSEGNSDEELLNLLESSNVSNNETPITDNKEKENTNTENHNQMEDEIHGPPFGYTTTDAAKERLESDSDDNELLINNSDNEDDITDNFANKKNKNASNKDEEMDDHNASDKQNSKNSNQEIENETLRPPRVYTTTGAAKTPLDTVKTPNVCISAINQSDVNQMKNVNNNIVKFKDDWKLISAYVPVSKFYKVPLIPPHDQSRKRKNETKRTDPKTKTVKLDNSSKAEDKVDRLALRKSKLKALAAKEKTAKLESEKQKEVKSKQGPSAPSKIKISDTRGKYLAEPISKPSNCLARQKNMKGVGLPKSFIASTSHAERVPQVPSVSNYVPKSTITNHVTSCLTTIYEGLDDIVFQILSWHPNWFQKIKLHRDLPPINSSSLQKIPLSFENYKAYYNIMKPLLMTELWSCVNKEFSSNTARCLKLKVRNSIPKRTHAEFDCYYYLTREAYTKNEILKEEDLILITFDFIKDRLTCRGQFLACVCHVNTVLIDQSLTKDFIHKDHTYAVASIRIVLKSFEGDLIPNGIMDVTFSTSLKTSLRLFRSGKFLESSFLCKHILNPDIKLYNTFIRGQQFNHDILRCDVKSILNNGQKQAILQAKKLCLGKIPGICLVHGPPGTGKSTVIIKIIQEILFSNNGTQHCVLVVAPSNGAVDQLVERIIKCKKELPAEEQKLWKVVRVGPLQSMNSFAQKYSLPISAQNFFIKKCCTELSRNTSSEIIVLRNKISSMERSSLKFPELIPQLSLLKREHYLKCKSYKGREYIAEYRSCENEILSKATIICTTLSSCVNGSMTKIFGSFKQRVTCCLIDEATQSNEIETITPLQLGIDKLVLVGDPKQLPAVVFSKEAKECGLGISLFSRIQDNFKGKKDNPIKFLNLQYRMHPEICKFPNHTYYDGLLKSNTYVYNRDHPVCNSLVPYLVFEFGSNIACSQEYSNKAEIDFVIKLLEAIITILSSSSGITVGIITPYNNQRTGINEKLQSKKFKSNFDISVQTVDSFQGQEKDIIIMSCVRRSPNIFLGDDQRLNVGLTRAKHALYVLGSESLFETCKVLGKLRDDAHNRKILRHINETTVSTLIKTISLKKKFK